LFSHAKTFLNAPSYVDGDVAESYNDDCLSLKAKTWVNA